ncbi:peptide chain release factor N(5)-glutamine methyltransferase [Marinomonas mediterranea]|uniref:peptide chain release factor N(5)-glutamine methyltransferase n=1 Tax=Marinomonas mediterranea TaxID=119864 RepID=UPI00234A9AE6|nr:peptide chain release factor N(5)-glutamine methyltransferase [Marinomonas mediterranea]WCN10144.1 peptide chain release factor N(5)-glutamine methyltransferase [Marinomonas mediterranea]
MRIDRCLREAQQRLSSVSDTAKLDAELLLAHCMQVSRTYLFTWSEKDIEPVCLTRFYRLLERRLVGEPIAYLIGKQDFWTLELDVSPTTLIPRPDTERLVEVALDLIAGVEKPNILDLGAGTGAIALALAYERKDALVSGADCVKQAVELATRNAEKNALSVNFIHSDWFSEVPSDNQFHLIVSNPPYIDPNDKHLSQGDVRFEPDSALTADQEGMGDINRILSEAPHYLHDTGWLAFEHGYDQGEKVRLAFASRGFLSVETFADYGGNDRVTIGQKQ